MSDIETTKTFRRIMDGEQKELESKIRSLLIDFEKRAGRIFG